MGQVRVFADPGQLAQAAAGKIAQRIVAVLGAGARFALGLSGGTTPAATYTALAKGPWLGADKWNRVEIYFADERAVPRDDPQSNYRMVRETLLEPARIPANHVVRIRAEDPDLEAVVAEYEARLPPALDLLILGVGEDGHTASIFPGSPVVHEAVRRVAAVRDSPKPPLRRVTVTPRVLREAREIMVLATGDGKAEAVWRALRSHYDPDEVPARMVREREWLIDEAAGSWLESGEGGPAE